MQLHRLLIGILVVVIVLLSQCSQEAQARRLIFYNPRSTTLTGQLLVSRKLPRPCPDGKMRDHRDRCRRAVIFGRPK